MYQNYQMSGNEDGKQIINRFNNSLELKKMLYFDVDEFEKIIEHFLIRNNLSKTKKAIDYAKHIHPGSYEIIFKEAEYWVQRKNAKQAFILINKLKKFIPNNTHVDLLKGFAHILVKEYSLAAKCFDKALQAEANPHDDHYEIAVAFEEQEAYDYAVTYFEMAYESNPHFFTTLFDLAFCYEKIGNNPKSIDAYLAYLDEDPFSESGWYNLGIAYSKTGDIDKAIECYDFALAINENYASAYFNKGNALANSSKYNESIEAYLAYINLEPENLQALSYIAECYEALNDNINAILYYKKIISIDDSFSDAWYGTASVLYADGKPEEGLHFIKKAIEQDASQPDYWYLQAGISIKLENDELAESSFKECLALCNDDAFYWLSYADFTYHSKGQKEAIKILNNSKEFLGENAQINYRLAALNLIDNQHEPGLQCLESALKTDSQNCQQFFDYYPQASEDFRIKKLISTYKKQ